MEEEKRQIEEERMRMKMMEEYDSADQSITDEYEEPEVYDAMKTSKYMQ
jgi:hypothetical protein